MIGARPEHVAGGLGVEQDTLAGVQLLDEDGTAVECIGQGLAGGAVELAELLCAEGYRSAK